MTGMKVIIELDASTCTGLLKMSQGVRVNGRYLGPSEWILKLLKDGIADFEIVEAESRAEQQMLDRYERSEKDCLWEGQ